MADDWSVVSTVPVDHNDWSVVKQEPQEKSFGQHLQDYYSQTQLFHPKEAAQGIVNAGEHPFQTAQSYMEQTDAIRRKAIEAFHRGDYQEAAQHAMHYVLNGIPGFGARLDEAAAKGREGDVGGMLADTASIATDYVAAPKVLGATVNKLTDPGVLPLPEEVVPATKAAAKAAAPDVAAGAGKIAAGAILDEMGVPSHYGTLIGGTRGIPQIGRGLFKGFRAGRASFQLPEASVSEAAPEVPAGTPLTEPPTGVDPKVWDQYPPNVQEHIRATLEGKTAAPASAPAPQAPRDPSYYGVGNEPNTPVRPPIAEKPTEAPAPKEAPPSDLTQKLNDLLRKVKIEGGFDPDKPLGEVKGGRYLAKFDEGGGEAPVIQSQLRKPTSGVEPANPSLIAKDIGEKLAGRITVEQQGQNAGAFLVAARILLGAGLAQHDRIDDFKMRGIGGERQVHRVAVKHAV